MSDLVPFVPLATAGRIADEIIRRNRLEQYQREKASQTLRRQQADIALFKEYLSAIPVAIGDLYSDITCWQGISMGILEGFKEWLLQHGYAIGSINVRLTTVKVYARIAFQSGVIDENTFKLIQTVRGIAEKPGRNLDEKRAQTRVGAKKAEPTSISSSHMKALKEILERQTDYTGCRDFLLVCLSGYQGLRCGEIAELRRANVFLEEGVIRFYRPKVNITQEHELHVTTLLAMQRYLAIANVQEKLFEGMDKEGWTDGQGNYHKPHKAQDGLSTRAINHRIGELGKLVGLEHLSPHDLRHYWTFDAFKNKTPIDVVMEAGGWKSYEMPLKYRGRSTRANEGIRQSS